MKTLQFKAWFDKYIGPVPLSDMADYLTDECDYLEDYEPGDAKYDMLAPFEDMEYVERYNAIAQRLDDAFYNIIKADNYYNLHDNWIGEQYWQAQFQFKVALAEVVFEICKKYPG